MEYTRPGSSAEHDLTDLDGWHRSGQSRSRRSFSASDQLGLGK